MIGRIMGLAYWPRSSTEKHLKEMARRLHGHVATEFSGITVGGVGVLCRRATAYMQPMRGEKYGRWHWKKPFGKESDWRKVDYVLLHGPEMGQYDEAFFLFTAREARTFAAAWPDALNIGTDPIKTPQGNRDKILKHQLSLSEVRRTLAR